MKREEYEALCNYEKSKDERLSRLPRVKHLMEYLEKLSTQLRRLQKNVYSLEYKMVARNVNHLGMPIEPPEFVIDLNGQREELEKFYEISCEYLKKEITKVKEEIERT